MRETRLTGLFSNILIGLSIFLLPYPLAYIPTAVLDGLFLYMAVTALNGNQMFERITLLFMEQVGAGKNSRDLWWLMVRLITELAGLLLISSKTQNLQRFTHMLLWVRCFEE